MDSAVVACRAVHFTAALLVFGAALFRLYAVDGSRRSLLDPPLRPVLLAAAAVALLSALAMLPFVGARMAGSAAAAFERHTLWIVLSQTSFGRAWRWHLLLALALLAVCLPRPAPPPALAVLAGLLLASLALVGHAAANPAAPRAAFEANDAAHLLAAGAWLGGLVPLGIVASRAAASRDAIWLGMLRAVLPRFSRVAYLAVALVALTGVVNALLLVGGIAGLTGTAYGRLLLAKLALVLLLLAVAVVNRMILTPRIAGDAPMRSATALAATIAIEQGLALAIIGAASILGTLPPAAHSHMH